MRSKILKFIFFVLIPASALATECLLTEALKNPELNSNPQFWQELTEISQNGKPSDAAIGKLIEKYAGKSSHENLNSNGNSVAMGNANTPSPSTSHVPNFAPHTYKIHSKAEKEIKALPANLKAKVDEFLDLASKPNGMQAIRENRGRWNFERIIDEGKAAYTVRLNDGYRVLFDYLDGHIDIKRVNKGQIHHN